MDLRISIRDENGCHLKTVVVYQDGSDSEGAQQVADLISTKFQVLDDEEICEECGSYYDDNPGETVCKTCEDWGLVP